MFHDFHARSWGSIGTPQRHPIGRHLPWAPQEGAGSNGWLEVISWMPMDCIGISHIQHISDYFQMFWNVFVLINRYIYILYSIIVHTHFVTSVSKQHFRTPFPPAPFLDRTPSRSTPATRTRLGQSWSAPESFQRRLSKCAMCQDQPRLDKEALGSRIWEIFMTSWYFMPVWVRIQKHWWHRRSRLMTVRIYKHLWL